MSVRADTSKRGQVRLYIVAGFLSLILAVLPTRWYPNLGAALAGWSVAMLQAGAALIIHRRAVASPGYTFLAWTLGSMSLRMMLLLGVLALVRATHPLAFAPFGIALIVSYLTLLYMEIARLHLESSAPARPLPHGI
ncbi:MAG: hypothetical protein O3B24_06000 [Verrucomicrobia bacterium]|nr:hypothetical protein [Verrucomicrobiota bacterium]